MISPNKIDSIEKALHKLQVHTDSLQAVVLKTEIGQINYDRTIAVQLGLFTLFVTIIVAIAGLISWGFIVKPFKKSIEEVKNEMANLINKQKKIFINIKPNWMKTFLN